MASRGQKLQPFLALQPFPYGQMKLNFQTKIPLQVSYQDGDKLDPENSHEVHYFPYIYTYPNSGHAAFALLVMWKWPRKQRMPGEEESLLNTHVLYE
jgi:hypothetical protein